MSPNKRVPKFYFSLRSPYSWLAYRELLDGYRDVAEQVEWVPFFEPDDRSTEMLTAFGDQFPYTPMSRAKHLYILQDVRRLAAARGLTVAWPVDKDPVWEVPHLGYLVARDGGMGPEFVAAAYRARWEQGRDICDPSVVAEIASSIGADPGAVAAAADDQELRERGVRILRDVCRDGVFGVPFFVHGFNRFWGLDRLEGFAAHLRAGRPPATEPAEVAVGGGRTSDGGHAGGCG